MLVDFTGSAGKVERGGGLGFVEVRFGGERWCFEWERLV